MVKENEHDEQPKQKREWFVIKNGCYVGSDRFKHLNFEPEFSEMTKWSVPIPSGISWVPSQSVQTTLSFISTKQNKFSFLMDFEHK